MTGVVCGVPKETDRRIRHKVVWGNCGSPINKFQLFVIIEGIARQKQRVGIHNNKLLFDTYFFRL